ncbi:unnamed protein product [Chrysodeixis includens]|uniref:Citrate transporter-like domain-containing protein n=1 Tax=Chrysodeixis includens TaxID=689277 RepID=A0A9P0FSZ0_CHRIL|nr:unnamed protein product [Chrysodeixis includens]
MSSFPQNFLDFLQGKRTAVEQKVKLMLGEKPPEPKPPKPAQRIKNLALNFRGIIGTLVPILLLPSQFERHNPAAKTTVMWKLMFWFFLIQPVNIPVTSLIPIFFLPMTGIMSTVMTCQCYMNENIVLYLLSGMLVLLLSNAGFDKRFAMWFLTAGSTAQQYTPRKLVLKVCMAAFFMSMFCNRLLVTSILTQHITSALNHMRFFTKGKENINFDELGYILKCAIQTSAGIGSIAIVHSTYTTIYCRAIFAESPNRYEEYPDIFNYLQYSAFAYPVACTAILINYAYFTVLVSVVWKRPLPKRILDELEKTFNKYRSKIPRICSKHERLACLFTVLYLSLLFGRYSYFHSGWAEYRRDHHSPSIIRIKDATTAAIFVILLHALPKTCRFLTYVDADTKSDLPPLKPESAILYWRYVDNNTNYGYMFLFGSGIALQHAIRVSGLQKILGEHLGTVITNRPFSLGVLIVCLISGVLCNIMPGVGACTVFCPFVLNMSIDAVLPWPVKTYVVALAVGIGTAFGFCFPFRYTPAYFCHSTGKVPILKMAMYSFCSVWICILTLWFYLVVYAPVIFEVNWAGVVPVSAPLDGGGTTSNPSPEKQ